jgi:hypothetical protein
MSTFSQGLFLQINTFLNKHPQIKTQLTPLFSSSKGRSQLVLAGVVGFVALVGVFSSISLIDLQQDIRQQAAGGIYVGAGCAGVTEGTYKCDVSNAKLVCAGGSWRTTGQTCPTASSPEPASSQVPAVYADPSICNENHPSYIRAGGYCETATLTR